MLWKSVGRFGATTCSDEIDDDTGVELGVLADAQGVDALSENDDRPA